MRWALVMIRPCAACRNTSVSRTTGTAPDAMMSASTCPGPTEGSWSRHGSRPWRHPRGPCAPSPRSRSRHRRGALQRRRQAWPAWTLERIHHALYVAVREQAGREASPTTAIIDSQSVKGARWKRSRRSSGAAAMSSATFWSTWCIPTASSKAHRRTRPPQCRSCPGARVTRCSAVPTSSNTRSFCVAPGYEIRWRLRAGRNPHQLRPLKVQISGGLCP
jgi:hypothetical protein